MFKNILCTLIALTCINTISFAEGIQHKLLSNGMEIYVIPDHSSPIVSHVLLYKVGAADELCGKSGLAHLLEHVMFRATKTNKDISKSIQNLGGSFNAMTSSYFTIYYEVAHKKKLEEIIKIEIDRMQNLEFTDNLFSLEKKIVLEERKMRIDNLPKTRLLEEMQAAFYRNDKSWQVAGWEHEINQLTKEDAKNMYNTFYSPSNAVLVVSGDITLEELNPLLTNYYEKIPNVEKPKQISLVTEPDHLSTITVSLADSTVKEKEIIYFFDAPNIYDSESLPLSLGNHILGSGRISRLYQALIINEPIATSVYSEYDPLTKSNAILSIEVSPSEDKSLAKVESIMQNTINELIINGITEEELEIAKSDFKVGLIEMQDGATKKGIFTAINLGMGLGSDYITNLPQEISKITINQVNDALKDVLSNKRIVKGYLLSDNLENNK